jgi:hypothetical protein
VPRAALSGAFLLGPLPLQALAASLISHLLQRH